MPQEHLAPVLPNPVSPAAVTAEGITAPADISDAQEVIARTTALSWKKTRSDSRDQLL